MGEITGIVKLYIEDSEILEDAAKVISTDLRENIQKQLYPGHGYDKGELHDDIYSDYTVQSKTLAVVVGGFTVEHGKYVLYGSEAVDGKLMKMPWGYRTKRRKIDAIDFLGDGLKETIAMYGG